MQPNGTQRKYIHKQQNTTEQTAIGFSFESDWLADAALVF